MIPPKNSKDKSISLINNQAKNYLKIINSKNIPGEKNKSTLKKKSITDKKIILRTPHTTPQPTKPSINYSTKLSQPKLSNDSTTKHGFSMETLLSREDFIKNKYRELFDLYLKQI